MDGTRRTETRGLPLLGALCLAFLLASPALAQQQDQSLAPGYYGVRGIPASKSSARVERSAKGLELTLYAGSEVFWRGTAAEDGVFRSQVSKGAVGALVGPEGSEQETLRLRPHPGSFHGVIRRGAIRRAVVRLFRQPRALIVKTSSRYPRERVWLWHYAAQVSASYQRRGYWVETITVAKTTDLIEAIERGATHPYERVVILGHAGTNDGIVMSSEPIESAERQVSPRANHSAHWPSLVAAIRVGTTPDAKIYAAGCWTGQNWAPQLAKATDRVVAGPTEKTAWRNTRALVNTALEGEGPALQQVIVAQGETTKTIPEGGGLSDAQVRDDTEALLPGVTRRAANGSGYRALLRSQAEALRAKAVTRRIETHYARHIDEVADTPAEADLMRGIVFEEQIHLTPGESSLESIGFGRSVGPSQIRDDLWAARYGTTRAGLLDPARHFKVMKLHLDAVRRQARENGLPNTPAALGAVWNSMRATRVTDYGRRIELYTARFADKRAARQRVPATSPSR